MKRKGFLKKIIGALCVGVLVSMPVTVKAASQEDVLGTWTGGTGTFIFYENGKADHQFSGFTNTRAYHMESGSLTGKDSSGVTVTVNYDLWRGDQINDVPTDVDQNAVIYTIIGSGRMKAWNAVKNAGSDEWEIYDPATITKAGSADSASAAPASSGSGCNHSYEWSITTDPTETMDGESSYVCTFCGDIKARQPVSAYVVIKDKLLASIKNAEAGATVTFDNNSWLCYPQYVLDALKEKGDVSLKTDFTYGGNNYSFTIHAGSDYTNLEEADFYGFMYLLGEFNGTIVE